MNREKNLMKYGFVSVLLLASFLMTVPANQYQKIFAQTEGETPAEAQGNVTEDIIENATDTEIPPFESGNATFVPRPESEREAPPVPPDAIKADELPNETLVTDPDSVPLSITNRTEILEVLPANSTKIIEHVDEDLKNSTGEGLLPPAILDKIKSGEGQGNDTILDISSPKELDEIKNFSESTTNQTTEEALEEGEPISISNVTNATATEAPPEEGIMNVTNATATEAPPEEGIMNVTNATAAEAPPEEQAQAGGEEQAQAGGEEQAQAGGEEQAQAGGEEQVEAITNATNATGAQAPEELLNTTNITSILNATDLEDENDSPENE